MLLLYCHVSDTATVGDVMTWSGLGLKLFTFTKTKRKKILNLSFITLFIFVDVQSSRRSRNFNSDSDDDILPLTLWRTHIPDLAISLCGGLTSGATEPGETITPEMFQEKLLNHQDFVAK